MSQHAAFRRQPVPYQVAQKLQASTIPAPVRGLTLSENEAYMKPGGAVVLDNWAPTLRGVKLRGGCVRWCELPETTPIISGFEYASGNVHKMFAANATKLYDVTFSGTPTLIVGGQLSGNWSAAVMSTAGGDFLVAANDGGDFLQRFDGTTWTTLSTGVAGPPGSPVELGKNLVYVWSYRNRLFFIEQNSMNAWYLGLESIGGTLNKIPLTGAAKFGGKLLFGASWSIDAGDGIDDKCCFVTDLGEVIIFTGANPGEATGSFPWHQEGLYQLPPPMGQNAHIQLGGDLLIATVDGLIPLSAAITKDAGKLDLSAVSLNIRQMWRDEAVDKREWPWTMKRWDEYGGMFVTWPGGKPGEHRCAAVNTSTNAWCRFTGWDATCFLRLRDDMFFGTQTGIIMQADRSGYDDGKPYVATWVGGWGAIQSQPSTTTWYQARASFFSDRGSPPFNPQLACCIDFEVVIPQPPVAGADPTVGDVWDQGKWGPDMGGPPPPVPTTPQREQYLQWDQGVIKKPVVNNTGWVSIGQTGYSHAAVVQVTVARTARPAIELISVDATFERLGVNV